MISSDRLAEALWGDHPPPSSPKSVQNLVLRLRKTLGREIIETRPGGYRLAVPPEAVDGVRFERFVTLARHQIAESERAAAVISYTAALSLWRGRPLPELADWAPAQIEAARLAELFNSAQEEQADAALAIGQHRDYVSRLESLVVEEPLRERRWELLVVALYRCGRQADALRAYQRARRQLAELGLEPGPGLQAIERAVASRDPSLDWQTRRPQDVTASSPRGAAETVVLWFTDIEGSTRGWASDAGMLRSLEQHDRVLRQVIDQHGGVEFKHTGDGLCATFPSVVDAVGAAVDAQRLLPTVNWVGGPALSVRVAVHVGSAHRRGDDWNGLALSRCARVVDVASGGQIVITEPAASMLREVTSEEIGLLDLGSVELRDLAVREHLWQVTSPGLRVEFPSLRGSTHGTVRPALSSLIGRAATVDRVLALLDRSRLVVLTGMGGIGKTRLALAVAESAEGDFSGGVWMVELAAAPGPEHVEALVAGALGFVPRAGLTTRELIVDAIGGRQLLVVLDNCEHVLAAAASVADHILRACPAARIMATSREPLGVEGEQVFVVPPLELEADAVDLFIERARSADERFDADDRRVIVEICRRLEGIPLAIELAAARVRTVRLGELVDRLHHCLDVLASASSGRVERHRTLRAAFDWSYDLLSDDERAALARLSVFAGRFELVAAETVISGPPQVADVLDVLSALVDKSLLVADVTQEAPYRLLEPVRQYALELALMSGATAELADRHAGFYADLCEHLRVLLAGPAEIEAAKALDAAKDNIRAAFAHAVAGDDTDTALRIVASLREYTNLHVWTEPWSWCETALGMPGADHHPHRAATLIHASHGTWQLGDYISALTYADEAIAILDPESRPWIDALSCRATALLYLGRLDEAETVASAAIRLRRDDPDAFALNRTAALLLTLNYLGKPDPEVARQLLEQAGPSSPSARAVALHTASLFLDADDHALAIRYNQEAAELAAASGAVLIEGLALYSLAESESQPAEAARRFVDVMAHYLRVGNRNFLRSFGRAIIEALVRCGAYEATAVVDGATRGAIVFNRRATVFHRIASDAANPLDVAIDRARERLGAAYESTVRRGAHMTDDELVHYLRYVVVDL